MEEFNQNNQNEMNEVNNAEETVTANAVGVNEGEPVAEVTAEKEENTQEPKPQTVWEKVEFPEINGANDYRPASKGLKIFSAIMALVILLTAASSVGYLFGRNSVKVSQNRDVKISLASRPKNTDEKTPAEIYADVNKSIVGIEVYNETGAMTQATGVVYTKDGFIITNDHIYSEVAAAKFKIHTYDGKEYDAKYVAGDSISDLAVLKVDKGNDFVVPTFGNSKEIYCGENVVAIGRPSDAKADSSITKGIISLTKRRMSTTSNYTSCLIQTDSAINPGSSGGALVNMYSQIIGITSSKLAGVEYDSMGFAIPTTTMSRVVSQLIKNGKVEDRAKLGITYTEVTSVVAELNNYSDTGLYVASVSDDSDLAGKVSKGDIITHINGEKIVNSAMVLDVIDESYAGDKISVTVVDTKGKTSEYQVTLKANIGESSYSANSNSSNNQLPNSGDDGGIIGGGDTFNFPNGE